MSLFHRHQWTEVARRFVPPTARKVSLGSAEGYEAVSETQQMMRDFANGYTVVELRCSECGKVSSTHLQGDAT